MKLKFCLYICNAIKSVLICTKFKKELTGGKQPTLNYTKQKSLQPSTEIWLQGIFYIVSMQVRRKIINEVKGTPMLQKALAITLLLKYKAGRNSIIKDYSINKLNKLTHISPTTLNKYLPIMERMGWICYVGKKKQHLVIRKIASHSKVRNINVDKFCFDTFKDIYNSIRTLLFSLIQARKDFIRRTIQIVANPTKWDNYKAARKNMKRLVRNGIVDSIYSKYKEFGLSYKRIAKEIGNCARTAFNVVKYAIAKGFVDRHKHQAFIPAKGICYRHVDGYTFSTRNNIYRIYANTYETRLV